MNAEIISYRCQRAQWETARLLMGLSLPLGLSEMGLDDEACRAAYDSMCEDGLLCPSGDEVIVDRLFALLLTQASRADLAIAIRCEGRQIMLHRAPELVLLSEWTPASCEWTPLPTATAAREPLFNLLRHIKAPVDLELLLPQGPARAETPQSPDAAREALEQLYNAFCVEILNRS